ncbi:MAG TPA: C39 family peptidase [Gaiellaceae bacterium]|jgi:uncharacterized protein YvpB
MRFLPLFLLLALTAVGCGGGSPAPRPEKLAVFAAGRRIGTVTPSNAARLRLPKRLHVRDGRARVVVDVPAARSRRAIRRALADGRSRLDLRTRPVSSSIAVRPIRQVLHNDCEATALSMILAAARHPAGQLALQAQLPQSGPLDPVAVPGSSLFRWGDPERGFVGRADGGGTEGGFGVYEPPIRALAARHGVRLVDLRHRSVGAVRAALLAGHPVLAWVGLADGPYLSWLTPGGREITVNLNEHAVALVGAGPGYVLVDNPLTGVRERWSESLFNYRWQLLGRRALELPRS